MHAMAEITVIESPAVSGCSVPDIGDWLYELYGVKYWHANLTVSPKLWDLIPSVYRLMNGDLTRNFVPIYRGH